MKKLLLLFIPGILSAQPRTGVDMPWDEAAHFLELLQKEPANAEAHEHVRLMAQELETRQHAATERERLSILRGAARRLEKKGITTRPVLAAFQLAAAAPGRLKQERLKNWREEAQLEKDLGHFLAAEDLVCNVLEESPSDAAAQTLLSDLQAEVKMLLDRGLSISVTERYALEGFYAYGQADYAAAVAAWDKAHAMLDNQEAGAGPTLAALHFERHEKKARAQVEEEAQAKVVARAFTDGVQALQSLRPAEALTLFRQVAIANPEYPHLADYLLQAEAEAEKDRTQRLTRERREKADQSFQAGLNALEQGKSEQAQADFNKALALDPGHPQAASYLKVAQAELGRRQDPKASQGHYEAGLVAYASGKLDDAAREWRVASRLDVHNEKAVNALAKVEKEIALFRMPPAEEGTR